MQRRLSSIGMLFSLNIENVQVFLFGFCGMMGRFQFNLFVLILVSIHFCDRTNFAWSFCFASLQIIT